MIQLKILSMPFIATKIEKKDTATTNIVIKIVLSKHFGFLLFISCFKYEIKLNLLTPYELIILSNLALSSLFFYMGTQEVKQLLLKLK